MGDDEITKCGAVESGVPGFRFSFKAFVMLASLRHQRLAVSVRRRRRGKMGSKNRKDEEEERRCREEKTCRRGEEFCVAGRIKSAQELGFSKATFGATFSSARAKVFSSNTNWAPLLSILYDVFSSL